MGMEEQDLGQHDSHPQFSEAPSFSESTISNYESTEMQPTSIPKDLRDGSQERMLRHSEPTPFTVPFSNRTSRLQSKSDKFRITWLTAVAACGITTFSIIYSYRVLVSHSVLPKHLALSPGNTVLALNVIFHVVTLLCFHLFMDAFEDLRWAWACHPRKGVLFASFLALSRATPLSGVWFLAFKRDGHQSWCMLSRADTEIITLEWDSLRYFEIGFWPWPFIKPWGLFSSVSQKKSQPSDNC
jgi:hypothetical protein